MIACYQTPPGSQGATRSPPLCSQTPAGVGGSTEAILFVFFSSGLCHGNADTGSRRRPKAGGGLRAFGTLRERGAHSALSGKQLDATKSRAGAGGTRRSSPARGPLPPPGLRGCPPLAGGRELHLVKPSPGIYRSLERNEVASGEEGGGRPTATAAGAAAARRHHRHRAHPAPGPRGGSGGGRRSGGGSGEARRSRGRSRSAQPAGPRVSALPEQLRRLPHALAGLAAPGAAATPAA